MARYGGKGGSRRVVLKGAAAFGGSAVGSSIGGFPTVWAQNIKDVVLRHAGPPVTAIPRIAEQATKDLGGLGSATASGRIWGLSPLGPSNHRWSLDGRAIYLPEASEPWPSGCQGQHRIGRGFGLAPFASSPRPSILHRHFGGRSQGSC